MNTYSAYKDSGEQWLGQIPAHWEMMKMKFCFLERSQKGLPKEPLLAATQNHGVILKSDYENRTVEAIKGLDSLKLVEVDDFVISLRSFQGGIERSYARGIISPAYTIIKPTHVSAGYFKYLGKSPSFISLLQNSVTGIREGQNIDYSKLKNRQIPLPPLAEQEAMVAYLDEQTGKIDAAIAREQKMIDLLEERKQIIIQHAVTKGLNPNAKMKDSGIEWIGAIPESWRKKRFKYLFKTSTGITFTKAQLENEGNPVLSYGQVHSKLNKSGTLNEELIKFIPNSLTAGKDNCLVYNGDFIFADTSEDFEGCGNNIYVDTEYPVYAGYHTIIARKQNDEYGKYLGYLFASKAWRGQVRTRVNGVKVYSITQGILNGSWVILPSKAEQIAIAEYLDKVIGVIDKEEAHRNRLISLLRERKQIIINEVVTGKIKVL